MVRRNHDQAEKMFRDAIDSDPGNVTNISNYANFLKRARSDDKRAEALYITGMKSDPNHGTQHWITSHDN